MKTYKEYWDYIKGKHSTFKHFSMKTRHGSHSFVYNEIVKKGWSTKIEKDYEKLEKDRKDELFENLKEQIIEKYESYHLFLKTPEFQKAKYHNLLKRIKNEIYNNPERHFVKSKWDDFETCLEESKKYVSRNDFRIFSPAAYKHAKKNYIDKERGLTWLDIMIPMTTLDSKVGTVYCYYFRNANINGKKDAVYVGISIEPTRRDKTHRYSKSSSVYKFSKQYNLEIPPMTILVDKTSIRETTRLEGYYIEQFSNKYHIINRAKCGIGTSATITYGLDGVKNYNIQELIEHIKNVVKYKTYNDFKFNKDGTITQEYKRASLLCCIREVCNSCGFKSCHAYYGGDVNKFIEDVKSLYETYDSFKHISETNKRTTNMWVTAKRNGWLLKTVQTLYPEHISDIQKYLYKFGNNEIK